MGCLLIDGWEEIVEGWRIRMVNKSCGGIRYGGATIISVEGVGIRIKWVCFTVRLSNDGAAERVSSGLRRWIMVHFSG